MEVVSSATRGCLVCKNSFSKSIMEESLYCCKCENQCFKKDGNGVLFGCFCDRCKRVTCKVCDKISSTEVRVLIRSTRVLIYWCMDCREGSETVEQDMSTTISRFETKLEKVLLSIRDSNADFLKQITSTVKESLEPKSVKGSHIQGPHPDKPVQRTNQAAVQGKRLRELEQHQRRLMSDIISLEHSGNESAAGSFGPQSKMDHVSGNQMNHASGNKWNKPPQPPMQISSSVKRGNTTLGANTNKLGISAVESRRHIFVSRLNPDTTSDQLMLHLKGNNVNVHNVEKLEIQSREIAAFKVHVPFSDLKTMFDPLIWPKYTIVRPFKEPRSNLLGGNFLPSTLPETRTRH